LKTILKSFDELYDTFMNEANINDAKVKEGKMHKILGLDPDESIPDKYKSGSALGKALLSKTDAGNAAKMLNYAANINKDANPIFKSALDYVEKNKPEEK
jgi:hypothetical protein